MREAVRSVAYQLQGSIVIGVFALGVIAGAAHAQTIRWSGGTGDWFDSGNWDLGRVPTAADRVTINNGGTAQVLVPGTISDDLVIGSLAGTGGSLVVTNGGTLRTVEGGSIAPQVNTQGSVTVAGRGSQWVNDTTLLVGGIGTGTLNVVNGGSVIVLPGFSSIIGSTVSSTGSSVTVDGAGSSLDAGSGLTVGRFGQGTLTISNGGLVIVNGGTGTVTLAQNFNGNGTLNIGAGGAAGILSAAVVNGGTGGGGARINFNHTDARYYFTNTGTASGTPIAITGAISVNHVGTGSTVLLGTHTYSGPTTINAGELVVDGSITSPVTVNSGGTVGGVGTINGAVNVASGGTFGIGDVVGATTVAGSVTFDAGSVYRVKVDAAGNAKRINVTGAPGTATLNGGAVDVQASPGLQANTARVILNAAGGVTGTFSGVTTDLAFMTPSLSYDPNNVLLTLTRNNVTFATVGGTSNQTAVERYLDAVEHEPGVAALIAQIETLSAAQGRAAFKSLDGDFLTAPRTVVVAESNRFLDLVSRRSASALTGPGSGVAGLNLAGISPLVSDAPAAYAQADAGGKARDRYGRGMWLDAGGSRGDVDSDGNATAFDWRTKFIAGGLDMETPAGTVLGAAFSLGEAEVFGGIAGSATVKSPRLALYGRQDVGAAQFRGVLGYANQEIDTRRSIVIGELSSSAVASHRGREWAASAEADYGLSVGGHTVRPLVGVHYIRLQENGYSETGSAAALTIAPRTTESIVSLLGVRYLRALRDGGCGFEARAIWGHEFGDTDPSISGRLATGPAGVTFSEAGVPIQRDALTLGVTLSGQATRNLFLQASFDAGVSRGGQNQQALALGLRYVW